MLYRHYERMYAKMKCTSELGQVSPFDAAVHLGRGQHSTQDWWAHGEYSKGPEFTIRWHGPSYDDWRLDAVGAAGTPVNGGRPPQRFSSYYNERTGMTMKQEEPWPYWKRGTLRLNGTRGDSKQYIRDFLFWVGRSGACECKEFFLAD
jgi:hypothetical protein